VHLKVFNKSYNLVFDAHVFEFDNYTLMPNHVQGFFEIDEDSDCIAFADERFVNGVM
jgi:hypothetical protein